MIGLIQCAYNAARKAIIRQEIMMLAGCAEEMLTMASQYERKGQTFTAKELRGYARESSREAFLLARRLG